MTILAQKRSFADRMIRKYGVRGFLRRNSVNRAITVALIEWDPREKGLRLEGSRRALISALDPDTGAPLAVPPDHELDQLVVANAL